MEKVNTGGTISFNYSKEYNPKITDEERRGIEEAYKKVDERKSPNGRLSSSPRKSLTHWKI